MLRVGLLTVLMLAAGTGWPSLALAQEEPLLTGDSVDLRGLFQAGGVVGYIILALSVAMLALIIEHLLTIRRGSLIPRGLPEDIHQLISEQKFETALERCRQRPSFLAYLLSAGLQEVDLGYSAVEKSMEDASAEQSARLFRKIEYLSVIGTLAPMLGLMGTVWGMIQAFGEFTQQANPQPADFAPGISRALVTTLLGLSVAVPALAAFAIFRNRIDEHVAEASLTAEHVFTPYKRTDAARRKSNRNAARRKLAESASGSVRTPPAGPAGGPRKSDKPND